MGSRGRGERRLSHSFWHADHPELIPPPGQRQDSQGVISALSPALISPQCVFLDSLFFFYRALIWNWHKVAASEMKLSSQRSFRWSILCGTASFRSASWHATSQLNQKTSGLAAVMINMLSWYLHQSRVLNNNNSNDQLSLFWVILSSIKNKATCCI